MNPFASLACAAVLGTGALTNEPSALEGKNQDICGELGLELAGRFQQQWPGYAINQQWQLNRSRLSLGLSHGQHLGARVAFMAARSAPDSSYLGIEGEAWIPRFQIAEARFALPAWGLRAGAGLVDDPWVLSSNDDFTWRNLTPTLTEQYGWMNRSDVGAHLDWTSPKGWVAVTGFIHNGEGARFRERNSGKSMGGMVEIRPLQFLEDEQTDALKITLYGREGSVGAARARSHRFGARVHGEIARIGYGFEFMKAWGVDEDPTLTPWGLSAWLRTEPWGPIAGLVRYNHVQWVPSNDDTDSGALMVAAGARLPFAPDARVGTLMLGFEHEWDSPNAAAVQGQETGRKGNTLFIQLDANMFWRGVLAKP